MDDPTVLDKQLKFVFNDLNAVKQGMVPLMPKKWKILRTFADVYHKLMHDFLTELI